MRRQKKDGEKMVSEDGQRVGEEAEKDGEKMVSEDSPKKLVRRLNKDGEKMISDKWSERADEEAE